MERKSWINIFWKVVTGLLVGIALAGLAFAAFFWFRVKSDAHFALRNAKNVRFAIETVGIEYYGDERDVFSAISPDGMARGVQEKVERLAGTQGNILLQEYDAPGNRVLKMQYTEGRYVVNFGLDENGDERWKIAYLLDLDLL